MKCDKCEYLHICKFKEKMLNFYLSDFCDIVTKKNPPHGHDETPHNAYTNAVFGLTDLCGHYKERKDV